MKFEYCWILFRELDHGHTDVVVGVFMDKDEVEYAKGKMERTCPEDAWGYRIDMVDLYHKGTFTLEEE